ncbi:MAG: HD domain-containing protein [Trueperaceae bacterium]
MSGRTPEARRARVRELLPELAYIANDAWREAVVNIWAEMWEASPWADPSDCPKHATHVPDLDNVTHTRRVTQQALAIAGVIESHGGEVIDRDVLVTAALLHDVSKMLESEPGPAGPRPSRTGKLVQHAVHGAARAIAHGLPDEVVHVVVGHTYQSATQPATPEAVIIHYVDFMDSDLLLLARDHPLFAKRR